MDDRQRHSGITKKSVSFPQCLGGNPEGLKAGSPTRDFGDDKYMDSFGDDKRGLCQSNIMFTPWQAEGMVLFILGLRPI